MDNWYWIYANIDGKKRWHMVYDNCEHWDCYNCTFSREKTDER